MYENKYKRYSSTIGNVTYDFYKKDYLEYNKLSKDVNQRIRAVNEKLISVLSAFIFVSLLVFILNIHV